MNYKMMQFVFIFINPVKSISHEKQNSIIIWIFCSSQLCRILFILKGYYKINMKFLKLLIVFCVIFSSQFSLAKTIDEQFSDVENLMEIDQNKEALNLLKTIDS